MVLVAVSSVHSGRPLLLELYYPPKKIPGQLRGIRSPPGLNKQKQDSPQKQEALVGLSSEAEASFWAWRDVRGPHRVTQQPPPLPRLGMASAATTRGAACPRRVSMDMTDKTRLIKTVPVGTTRLKMALLAGTRELDPRDLGTALLAETGELDPLERVLGLSQQRPAGLPHELQAGLGEPRMAARRSEPRTVALISPRTAGLRVLQTAVLSERQPTNLTLEPRTAALISPWMAGLRVPRTAVGLSDSRHSQRSRQTLSLYQLGLGGITIGDFLAAGQTQTGTKQKLSKNEQNKIKNGQSEWAPLTVRSGLLSRCTQQGGTRNTQTRIKLKYTVFNSDEARQGRADTQEHRGVMSRPDEN